MPYRARLGLHGIAGRRALNGPAPLKVRERRPERDQGFRSPLSYVAASQLCTGSAFWALLIAAYRYAIYHLHATPLQAGLLSLAWSAPPVLLGWPVGRLVDLRGPKSVAIYSGTVNIAVSLALAAMPSWRLLLGLMLCAGVARAVNQPALDAMPSWLVRAVDHRVSSAWLGLAMHIPLLAGPLLAAGLISLAGYACVYLVNAGLHVAALLAIAPVRTRNCADDTGEQAPRDRYLLRRTAARPILALSFVVAISYSCYDLLEMFYVRDTLHSGFRVYTALLVLYGLGLLITAAFLMRHPRFLPLPRALGPIVVFLGLSEIAYVLTARLWVCSGAAVLLGVASALFAPMCQDQPARRCPCRQARRCHGRLAVHPVGRQRHPAAGPRHDQPSRRRTTHHDHHRRPGSRRRPGRLADPREAPNHWVSHSTRTVTARSVRHAPRLLPARPSAQTREALAAALQTS